MTKLKTSLEVSMFQPKPITGALIFNKKYTFCTLVTDFDEYQQMVSSAKNAGFDSDDVEFLYFNNQSGNHFDGYSGINRAFREAQGEYLIFCHQDILFHDDKRNVLDECLAELEKIDATWAVAGNAGKDFCSRFSARITDPKLQNIRIGNLPKKVMSLDENLMILNRKHNFSTSSQVLSGFHLYALDLCQNAYNLGLTCYVIDFHILHKSSGNLNQSYYKAQDNYIKLQQKRKGINDFFPLCSSFYVSTSSFKNAIFKNQLLLKWRRSYLKRKK